VQIKKLHKLATGVANKVLKNRHKTRPGCKCDHIL